MTDDLPAPTNNPASQIALYSCRHGSLLHNPQDQTIGASLSEYGEWAEEELFLLSHLIERDHTVLDLGANVGTHALAFSRFVAPAGRVVAIDAQPVAFRLLTLNLLMNDVSGAIPICAVVSNTSGSRLVALDTPQLQRNLGSTTFVGSNTPVCGELASSGVSVPVAVTTIDALRFDRCDLIKIDVEGMELEALKGAEATLCRFTPVLYYEQVYAANFGEIFSYLRGLGYVLYWHVARPFNRNNFKRATHNIFGVTREVNVLAVASARKLPDAVLQLVCGPIVSANYEPPLAAVPFDGWALPENAYANLPAFQAKMSPLVQAIVRGYKAVRQ
jgi:FkbM family methyltransferase